MIRIVLLVPLLLNTFTVTAQNTLFSQYKLSPQTLNPAWAAASSDWRIVAQHRREQFGGGYTFRSSQFTISRPLFSGKRRYGGFSFSALDDHAGEVGWYRLQRVGASLAHDIPLSPRQRLSLGFQANYQIKRISSDDIRTGSQFRPNQGFDPTLGPGETMSDFQASYLTLGTGLLWYAVDRYEATTFYLGLSWLELNRPDESFLNGNQPLPATLSLQSGFRAYQKNRFTLFPELLLTHRAGISLLNLGSRFTYDLKNASQASTRVDFITRYTVNRSVMLGLQWHQPSYTIGLSFDTDASSHTLSPFQNAVEVAFAWHQAVTPKNKPPRKHRNKNKKEKKLRRNDGAQRPEELHPISSLPPHNWTDSAQHSLTIDVPPTSPHLLRGKLNTTVLNLAIEFSFNQTTVTSSSEAYLLEIATFLQQHSALVVTLTGHTDDIGSNEANLQLSLERARSVRDFLAQHRIAPGRIRVEGRGEYEPLYPNTDDGLRAKNRRVEISFSSETAR